MATILATVLEASVLLAPAPALAETAIDGLANANKLFHDGDAARALEQIAEVFAKGKLDNDTTAKALLLRGEIYEKSGKPALAYADYNDAVWLGGLSTAERNRANEGVQRTQAALGLAGGEGSSQTARGPSHASAEASPGGSTGFLANLFGGGSSTEQPRDGAKQQASRSEAPKAAGSASQEKAWKPQSGPSPAHSAANAAPSRKVAAAPAAPAGGDDKSYYTQFAALTEEARALSEAKRLAKKLGGSLGGRPVLVVKTEAGGGKPALYRVVSGPLANKAEADALCKALKAKGSHCMLYAP